MSDNKYHIYKPGDIIQWLWHDGGMLPPILVIGYNRKEYYRAINLDTGQTGESWEFGNKVGRWVQLA